VDGLTDPYALSVAESPPGEVVVRAASYEDVPRLVELLEFGSLEAGREDPRNMERYRQALVEIDATPGCEVLVAAVRGEVVGVCQLIVFRHFQSMGGRCAEIESMHVHPEWRGRGIGGLLLENAVSRAIGHGCYRVQLTSNKKRDAAHRFYQRHGFEQTHEGFKRSL
jgi:GNAT superfamily N-acetyltransferase